MIRPRDLFRRKGTAPKEAREKKDSLERSLDSLAKWLEFFTAIVVVGLVVEYTPDVISAIRDHILHPHIIGGILITIGVAGELLIGFRASRVDNELREINNSTIAAAHERVAVLEAEIEQEQQRTAEAQKAAAEAQKELAENLSTFALRSGDRVLNFQKFVDGLKKSPTLTVEAWCVPNSDEAERFSTEIVRALQHVEWPVLHRTFTMQDSLDGILLGRVQGMLFFFHDEDDMRSGTFDGFMWSLLKAVRFGAVSQAATTAPQVLKGTVVLVIGPRVKV